MLRIKLLNDQLGSFVIDRDDPIDINSLTQIVKRSEDNDGVVYEVIVDVEFIKAGRRYIKKAFEQTGGIEAVVIVYIYERNLNTKRWELYVEGKVNFNKYILSEDKVTVTIEQTGFQRRILNMLEVGVNMETLVSENGSALPPNNVFQMLYHSKALQKQSKSWPGPIEGATIDAASFNIPIGFGHVNREVMVYGAVGTEEDYVNELSQKFSLPYGWENFGVELGNGFAPGTTEQYVAYLHANKNPRFEMYKASEAGVMAIDVILDMQQKAEAVVGTGGDFTPVCGGELGNTEIRAWFELRDKDDTIILLEPIGVWNTVGWCGGDIRETLFEHFEFHADAAIEVGHKIYVYTTSRVYGSYDEAAGVGHVSHNFYATADQLTYISLKNKTVTPATEAKTVMFHEAVNRCCQFYTNQEICFKSDLLGRIELDYGTDGAASLIGLTNGINLRGVNKPIIFTLKDLLEFGNSIQCTGFGFESLSNGQQILRYENKNFFYDKNTKILSLGKVYDIKKTLISKNYHNQIEFGYSTKVDIQQLNATDEFQTVRRYTNGITNSKNTLKISTKMITGGYQIESQRRFRDTTQDAKLDDSNFAVVVIRDASTFKSKAAEGYYDIQNVIDPLTGYNYDISPGRNLLNWLRYIASGLIYSETKELKFSYGEVNYLMKSIKFGETAYIEENGTVPLNNIEPIWDNMLYSLTDVPMSSNLFKLIKQNPYGYIEFEDLFGEVMQGFISGDGIEHDSFKKTADLELLKVFRP